MNKQKQIEEMAEDIRLIKELQASNIYTPNYQEAMALISLGYKKIPKDSVVLTEEQFSEFRQAIINLSQEHTKKCDEVNDKIIKARKQAIKEVLERVNDCMRDFEDDDDGYILKKCEFKFFMREIAKEFGVEL